MLGYSSNKAKGPDNTSGKPIPLTFFGLNVQDIVNAPAYLGWGSHRVMTVGTPGTDGSVNGCRWRDIEPSKGTFRWTGMDAVVNYCHSRGIEILYTITDVPNWASRNQQYSEYNGGTPTSGRFNAMPPYNPGAADPTQDLRDFVTALLTRYKGKIRAIEAWNEPNLAYYGSDATIAYLVSLTKAVYQAAKAIDPNVLVTSPAYTLFDGVSIAWSQASGRSDLTRNLESFLQNGGGQWCDVIGVHLYSYPEPPEEMIRLGKLYRDIAVKYGAGNKPMWNTEGTWNRFKVGGVVQGNASSDDYTYTDQMPDDLAVSYLIRFYVCNWLAGMDRAFFYGYDQPWSRIRLTEPEINKYGLQAVPSAAYQRAINWLKGATVIGYTKAKNGIHQVTMKSATGKRQYIIWCDDDLSRQINLRNEWNINEGVAGDGATVNIGATLTVSKTPLLLTSYSGQQNTLNLDQVEGSRWDVKPYTITLGTGTKYWQNNTGYPMMIVFIGGTVTSIKIARNDNAYHQTGVTSGPLWLAPLDKIELVSTVEPTIRIFPM